jgi:hypothetical protein
MTSMCVGLRYWTRAGFLQQHTVLMTSKSHPNEGQLFILSGAGVPVNIVTRQWAG